MLDPENSESMPVWNTGRNFRKLMRVKIFLFLSPKLPRFEIYKNVNFIIQNLPFSRLFANFYDNLNFNEELE